MLIFNHLLSWVPVDDDVIGAKFEVVCPKLNCYYVPANNVENKNCEYKDNGVQVSFLSLISVTCERCAIQQKYMGTRARKYQQNTVPRHAG